MINIIYLFILRTYYLLNTKYLTAVTKLNDRYYMEKLVSEWKM